MLPNGQAFGIPRSYPNELATELNGARESLWAYLELERTFMRTDCCARFTKFNAIYYVQTFYRHFVSNDISSERICPMPSIVIVSNIMFNTISHNVSITL